MGLIIGTAGHIDHGKTSLVKALTGQDTDRLKEEKERGISIDLGFAYLDLPDGTRAGVVDVPGHERFIRNMLAGAHGIDLVLFTVAADDGVMPQTEEHLDIVHLLGVPRGIFAITKADLAPPLRLREVEAAITSLVSGTTFEHSPIVPCSCVTGQGLDEIRVRIADAFRASGKPSTRGYFRLPVDRVFVLQGHGLVVTGTAIGGRVTVDDRVRCLPGLEVFRVRGAHVHNEAVKVATEGQRVALNLAGAERTSIVRGHVIVDEALTLMSDCVDAWLELRSSAAPGLKDHQRVRVHIGTAERLARVRLLGASDRLKPNEPTYCQITFVEPLPSLRGDRFIIRDETARRTLGGGVVIHPSPRKRKRTDHGVWSALDRLHHGDLPTLVETFLDDADDVAVPEPTLLAFLNAPEPDTPARVERIPAVRVFDIAGERHYTTSTKVQRVTESLLVALHDFHAAHPLVVGMDLEAARCALAFPMSARLFRSIVDELAAGGEVVREATALRLPQHTIVLKADDRLLVERITALLEAHPLAPPTLGEIEQQLGVPLGRLREVIRVMERPRLVVRVAVDLYFLSEYVERVAHTLRERWPSGERITPAAFRDAIGTTRKYAIPLLEYFDRAGMTVRVGDVRRLKNTSSSDGGAREVSQR